ncbi:MAG: hypothetical protein M0Z76_10395 [Gammaproteobacteria bacterium]|nr:hypothetical protein [Gammaproteobacteria bacterium]
MRTRLSDHDRLGVALFFAGLLHVIFILGVRFRDPVTAGHGQTLDVTLVQARSDRAPRHAQRLAQVNVAGGGGQHRRHMARSPFRAKRHAGGELAARTEHRSTNRQTHWRLIVSRKQPLKLTLATRPWKINAALAADLGMNRRFLAEEARLKAEIRRDWRAYRAAGTGRGGVTARQFAYAGYISRWTAYMEHISNGRYRQVLLTAHAHGRLVLDVAIRANGTLASVRVVRGGSSLLLARIARSLVRRAAPFAPLPKVTDEPLAVLHIVETWRFRGRHMTSMQPAVSSGP